MHGMSLATVRPLLAAERRGRALMETLRLAPAASILFAARDDADGHALLAAARWSRLAGYPTRLGMEKAPQDPSPVWEILAENCLRLFPDRREEPTEASRCIIKRQPFGDDLSPPLPDAHALWRLPLAAYSGRWLFRPPGGFPTISSAACREIDVRAGRDFAIPGICLMENAAAAAVAVGLDILAAGKTWSDNVQIGKNGSRLNAGGKKAGESTAPAVLVVAGGGNNGGDGLAVARALDCLGIPVEVALAKPAASLKGDALINLRLLEEDARVPLYHLSDRLGTIPELLAGKALLIDALLGTGFSGPLLPAWRRLILDLNASRLPCLALDLPSGLDADSGAAPDGAVRASRTVTFAALKPGLLQGEGPAYSGEIYLGAIGAP